MTFYIMNIQGIIDMNRNGNSANFFSYVCNGKKSKELFASTLNRIPVSVRCVSSIIVVVNVKFASLLAAHRNEEARLQCHVFLAETLMFNFHRCFDCARKK